MDLEDAHARANVDQQVREPPGAQVRVVKLHRRRCRVRKDLVRHLEQEKVEAVDQAPHLVLRLHRDPELGLHQAGKLEGAPARRVQVLPAERSRPTARKT